MRSDLKSIFKKKLDDEKLNPMERYEKIKIQILKNEIAPKGGIIPSASYLEVMGGYVTYLSLTKFPYYNFPLWQEVIKPLNVLQ